MGFTDALLKTRNTVKPINYFKPNDIKDPETCFIVDVSQVIVPVISSWKLRSRTPQYFSGLASHLIRYI